MASPDFKVRFANRADLPALVGLIQALADYEGLRDRCVVDEVSLERVLFEEERCAEALVGIWGDEAVGMAIFFRTLSTFLGKPGLYLEDLFVKAEFRRRGLGRALLTSVIELARDRGCGRFEWAVLDWNAPAIGFYESLGAEVLPDWRICRLSGAALTSFSASR